MTMDLDEPQNRNVGFAPDDDFAGDFSDDVRARIKSELEPGERLLWSSRSSPPPSKRVSPGYFVMAGISIGLIALGFFIVSAALEKQKANAPADSMMSGLFVLGLGIFTGIVSIACWRAGQAEQVRKANLLYAITNQRAITWALERNGIEFRIKSVYRGEIAELERIQRPDGSGTLWFKRPAPSCDEWPQTGFENVPEVRRVEAIFRNNLMKRGAGE